MHCGGEDSFNPDFVQPCNTPGNVIDMCEVGLRRNDVGLVGLITEVLQQCHCWLMFGVSTVQPSAGQHCHSPHQPHHIIWWLVKCQLQIWNVVIIIILTP